MSVSAKGKSMNCFTYNFDLAISVQKKTLPGHKEEHKNKKTAATYDIHLLLIFPTAVN